jgi:hypothetical protein
MADAYRQKPDEAEPELIDPAAWEPRKSATPRPSALSKGGGSMRSSVPLAWR